MIQEPEQAEAALNEGQVDLIVLARAMLDDPNWPYHAAEKLGVTEPYRLLPSAYGHWLKR